MNRRFMAACLGGMVLAFSSAASAVIIETAPVGNTGNTGEWAGQSYGGNGSDRICGAVDYAYNIGKYEVTAGQYCEFLNAVAATDTYDLYIYHMWSSTYGCKIQRSGSSGSYTYSIPDANRIHRPVNYVSYGDAARFVNWLHNGQPTGGQDLTTTEDGAYYLNGATTNQALLAVTRKADWKWAIPTEDEWYKAAYHQNDGDTGNYFDYPTSSDSTPGRDMTEVTNPGNNANYRGNPLPIDSPCYTTVGGEFEYSESPYGTFDQGGNVYEWNETLYGGGARGMRGGSYIGYDYYLLAAYRSGAYPSGEDPSIGFRVCQVPEPATAGLLLMGSAALLVRRRRR